MIPRDWASPLAHRLPQGIPRDQTQNMNWVTNYNQSMIIT